MISIIIAELIDDILSTRGSSSTPTAAMWREIDSRASDAIALAVRTKGVPIYVTESVLEQAGVSLQSMEEREESASILSTPRERWPARSR